MQLHTLSTIQPIIIINSTVHVIHHPLLLELTERNRATTRTLNNTTNFNYKQYSTCHSSSSSLLEPWLRGTVQLPALSTIQPTIIINSTVHVIHHPLLLELAERNRATTHTLNNTTNYNYKQYSTCHSSSSSLGTMTERNRATTHTLNNTANYNYKQYSTCHSSSSSVGTD